MFTFFVHQCDFALSGFFIWKHPQFKTNLFKMSERGMNHFLKALKYFVRSFKPANIRTNAVLVGTDHIGNKYFEVKAGKIQRITELKIN